MMMQPTLKFVLNSYLLYNPQHWGIKPRIVGMQWGIYIYYMHLWNKPSNGEPFGSPLAGPMT